MAAQGKLTATRLVVSARRRIGCDGASASCCLRFDSSMKAAATIISH